MQFYKLLDFATSGQSGTDSETHCEPKVEAKRVSSAQLSDQVSSQIRGALCSWFSAASLDHFLNQFCLLDLFCIEYEEEASYQIEYVVQTTEFRHKLDQIVHCPAPDNLFGGKR